MQKIQILNILDARNVEGRLSRRRVLILLLSTMREQRVCMIFQPGDYSEAGTADHLFHPHENPLGK